MRIWITRDGDGDWKAWYDEPQLRPTTRSTRNKDGEYVDVEEGEYRCEVERFGGSDVEVLAHLLGVDPQAGSKVLVEVTAGIVEA